MPALNDFRLKRPSFKFSSAAEGFRSDSRQTDRQACVSAPLKRLLLPFPPRPASYCTPRLSRRPRCCEFSQTLAVWAYINVHTFLSLVETLNETQNTPSSPPWPHSHTRRFCQKNAAVLLVPLLPRVGERRGPPLVPGRPVGGHRGLPGGSAPRRTGGPGGWRPEHAPVLLGAPACQVTCPCFEKKSKNRRRDTCPQKRRDSVR